jgi:hypothetical protein
MILGSADKVNTKSKGIGVIIHEMIKRESEVDVNLNGLDRSHALEVKKSYSHVPWN